MTYERCVSMLMEKFMFASCLDLTRTVRWKQWTLTCLAHDSAVP
jgi:hypothetical protein